MHDTRVITVKASKLGPQCIDLHRIIDDSFIPYFILANVHTIIEYQAYHILHKSTNCKYNSLCIFLM